MFRVLMVLTTTSMLALSGCNEANNSSEISIPSEVEFDSENLENYTASDLSEFYSKGVPEAKLKRCYRSVNNETAALSEESVMWCKNAADEGLVYAYLPLAHYYASLDTDEDTKTAQNYYLLAGESGAAGANYEAAKIYLSGPMGIADYTKATELSEKMLSSNEPMGAAILAQLAFNGLSEGKGAADCLGLARYGKEKFLEQNVLEEGAYSADLAELNFLETTCANGLSSADIGRAQDIQNELELTYGSK